QPRGLRVLTQERQTKGVDGAARHGLGPGAERVLQPGGDLAGRAVGEGDGADPVRIESPLDEMFDARDETIGLARAGTRHDEPGAERRFDRGALLGEGWAR